MSKLPEDAAVGRILLALDSSAEAGAAIEAAAALAAELKAELLGLFIENAELFRLAGLPFAAEIGLGPPAVRRLDREALARAVGAQAEKARRALAEAANRQRLSWSFQVARGQSVRLALAAAGEFDWLMIRFAGRGPRPSSGLRRAAGREIAGNVMVVLDAAAPSERALATALRLGVASGAGVAVLLVGADALASVSMRERLAALRPQPSVKCLPCDAPVRESQDLLKAVRERQPEMLVIDRDSPLLTEQTLTALAEQLDCPLLLVR